MKIGRFSAAVALVVLAASVVSAEDQGSSRNDWAGWGVRVGVADSPDQVVVGAQYDFGEFAHRVHLEPNIELGFGDDHTILSVTGAVQYHFSAVDRVRPYAGGGLVLGFVDHDLPGNDDSDFEIALEASGGVRWPLKKHREFFLELNIGFGDLHDAQVLAGWRF